MSHQGTVLSPRPLARAIRVGLLTGSVAGIGLLAGCTDGGSGRFVDADKSTIGDPVKGELTSGSEINLKDGSRHGRHWMCGTAGDVGVLYQVKAPFLSQVSLYDDSGERPGCCSVPMRAACSWWSAARTRTTTVPMHWSRKRQQ